MNTPDEQVTTTPQNGFTHDDMSALEYVLHHVKGSSASSVTLLQLEEMTEE